MFRIQRLLNNLAALLIANRLLGSREVVGFLGLENLLLRSVGVHDLMGVVGVVGSGTTVMDMLMAMLVMEFQHGIQIRRYTLLWRGIVAVEGASVAR
jgi:hypothetical protein